MAASHRLPFRPSAALDLHGARVMLENGETLIVMVSCPVADPASRTCIFVAPLKEAPIKRSTNVLATTCGSGRY